MYQKPQRPSKINANPVKKKTEKPKATDKKVKAPKEATA